MTSPNTRRVYGDESIHRPPKYGEGDVSARHTAARARARAERPHAAPGRTTSTGADMTARAFAQLAARQAARASGTGPQTRPGDLERRLAEQQRRRDAAYALASLAEDFEDYVQAQLGDEPAVVEWAAAAAGGADRWLLLLGPTGVGKTWQAAAAYRAVTHDRGVEGLAIGLPDLLRRSLPSSPDRINLRTYEKAPVLLLDDLSGDLSEWKADVLFQLIAARDAAARLTILTSNLRREEVRDQLGDRLASRLSHRLRLVTMEGPDRRIRPGG